jgi:16S rRNA (uracil1498-N3)-methyltransferase
MNRFFLSENQIVGDTVIFPSDITHQIRHVLRLDDGDVVEVLNNKGDVFRVSLTSMLSHGNGTGKIIGVEKIPAKIKTRLSLCFGLSHRDKVELILQKGTEVGVSGFYPFISSRTLVQSAKLSTHKKDRWERIIREAAEQSRRIHLPVLNQPLRFDQCLVKMQENQSLCLLAWESAEAEQLSLSQLLGKSRGESIAVYVGPEGGFSEEEVRQARDSGCNIISLGKRILRMETAAIVLPVLVLHEMGEL